MQHAVAPAEVARSPTPSTPQPRQTPQPAISRQPAFLVQPEPSPADLPHQTPAVALRAPSGGPPERFAPGLTARPAPLGHADRGRSRESTQFPWLRTRTQRASACDFGSRNHGLEPDRRRGPAAGSGPAGFVTAARPCGRTHADHDHQQPSVVQPGARARCGCPTTGALACHGVTSGLGASHCKDGDAAYRQMDDNYRRLCIIAAPA